LGDGSVASRSMRRVTDGRGSYALNAISRGTFHRYKSVPWSSKVLI
jgi:hypothetical protein